VENSERDGNTRPPDLPLEKPVCSQEATVRTGHGTTRKQNSIINNMEEVSVVWSDRRSNQYNIPLNS